MSRFRQKSDPAPAPPAALLFDKPVRARYNVRMTDSSLRFGGVLNGNAIKIMACALMFVDHLGAFLFPEIAALRAVGRLAMPLFAFLFAEGCFYTRRKLLHFLLILGMGLVTSAAYSFAYQTPRADILITFSLACLVIYPLGALKRNTFRGDVRAAVLSACALLGAFALAVYVCCFSVLRVDYGLGGVLLPATVRLFDFRSFGAKGALARLYAPATALLPFVVCLLLIALPRGTQQLFSLCALPILLLYNGTRGTPRLKYFFYVFYPAHLLLLAGIAAALDPSLLADALAR